VRHKYGRLRAAATAALLALGAWLALSSGPAAVAAAEPADGTAVVLDAALTVRYTDATTLLPVDGARVHVVAVQGDAPLGEYDGTTDAEGVVVVAGLPIETGQGPAVRLSVVADKATTSEDPESGCRLAESWHAERLGVVVESAAIEVAFGEGEQQSSSSITCPDTTPSGGVGSVIGTPGAPAITPPATDGEVAAGALTSDIGAGVVVVFIFAMAGVSLIVRRPRRGDH